jgi:AcrR family transcriptional regulator
MSLPKYRPSQPIAPPPRGVKASTFKLLVETAMDLIRQDGHIPTVAEVAVRSRVSRATAYRYFPSRSALITTVIDASLGTVRSIELENPDGRERVRELFKITFPRFQEFEPQLRAALQLALEQWALERAGLLEEEPYRRGHRVQILGRATQPLAKVLPPAVLDRLQMALSVIYGIEPYVIFKDIWGLRQGQVEKLALWMADALIDAALRDAGQTAHAKNPEAPVKPRRPRSAHPA